MDLIFHIPPMIIGNVTIREKVMIIGVGKTHSTVNIWISVCHSNTENFLHLVHTAIYKGIKPFYVHFIG